MSTLSTAITGAAARPSGIRVAFKRVVQPFAAFWRARTNRREVSDLLRLDDRMLKDIGLTRSDVVGALAEPAGVDPSVGLRLRRGESRVPADGRDVQSLRLKQPRPARVETQAARLAA